MKNIIFFFLCMMLGGCAFSAGIEKNGVSVSIKIANAEEFKK